MASTSSQEKNDVQMAKIYICPAKKSVSSYKKIMLLLFILIFAISFENVFNIVEFSYSTTFWSIRKSGIH